MRYKVEGSLYFISKALWVCCVILHTPLPTTLLCSDSCHQKKNNYYLISCYVSSVVITLQYVETV